MSNVSNIPVDVAVTNGSVAVKGSSTGAPPIPIVGRPKAGVLGSCADGAGIFGESYTGPGVEGESIGKSPGTFGTSDGVLGVSGGNGVHGKSSGSTASGVWGENIGAGYGVSGWDLGPQ